MKILISLMIVALVGCKASDQVSGEQSGKSNRFVPSFTAGPQTLVYKTRADYRNLVPVILSEDKSKIVFYPDPQDIRSEKGFPVPSLLHLGYLLDNRGIGKNVAFLSMTYREYASLPMAPSIEELNKLILDRDPLTELCDCGNRNTMSNPVKIINRLIDGKVLRTTCKVIK